MRIRSDVEVVNKMKLHTWGENGKSGSNKYQHEYQYQSYLCMKDTRKQGENKHIMSSIIILTIKVKSINRLNEGIIWLKKCWKEVITSNKHQDKQWSLNGRFGRG